MVCPKCHSENVTVEREDGVTIGGSKTSITKKRHGLFYWIFIGWWFWIIKLCALPFTIWFSKKKKVGEATTASASYTTHKTIAVCQNCGHTWKVK